MWKICFDNLLKSQPEKLLTHNLKETKHPKT